MRQIYLVAGCPHMIPANKGRSCTHENYVQPKECCALAVAALDRHVNIPMQGSLTQTAVFRTLVGMAAMQQSVHSIARLLERSPCGSSLRHHLAKLSMDDLELVNTEILAYALSSVMTPGRAYTFAIDFTNDPYYGTVVPDKEWDVVRSRLKKATNDFYSYLTVYAITRDRPVTLAVYPATKGTSNVAYIARCLDAITATGLRVRALCLDREFYARKVIAFLTTIKVPFIIPVSQPDCYEHNVWDGAGFSFDTRHSSLTPPSSQEVTL